MAQAFINPIWNLSMEQAEMRILSLALLGRIKPDTPDATAAADLLKGLNAQRLQRLRQMVEPLERWSEGVSGDDTP